MWQPLLDVTEDSMVELIKVLAPDSPLSLVTRRIISGLGASPDSVISAFQSVIDDDSLMAGFSSAM
jgi:hypothetical protein